MNHVGFELSSVDSLLLPDKCTFVSQEMHIVTCGCKKKCTGRCQCSKFGVSCTECYKYNGDESAAWFWKNC